MYERKISTIKWTMSPLKDPKEMSEEEKNDWKARVFAECKIMDARIAANLKQIQEERSKIKETVAATSVVVSSYQEEVDRISRKAQELLLPELEKREEALRQSVAPMLCTEARALKRRPKIETVDVEPDSPR